jgi:8-oxo-dGTP pyrophosphatase MutT (NUDIX family)
LDRTGFFGAQGAGCIPMSKVTGRILLGLRSGAVEQPGTWGGFGGAHHGDERPVDAATRELHEETGFDGQAAMVPLLVFQSGSFVYHNFLALVDAEFIPDLGWEADAHKWCTLDDLPHPLHFGFEAVLNDPASYKTIVKYMEGLK